MSLLERHEQILDSCVESLKSWKQLISEYLDGEDKNVEMGKLKQITKDYCNIESNFQSSMKALRKVEDKLNEDDTSEEDVQKLYEDNLRGEKQLSPANYKNHDIWQKVLRGISDVMEVKQKESKLDECQFEELGDSLLCSNVFTPPIDPISKTVIRNPYKSKKCRHVYEYSTIVDYIKQQKRRAKCPYIGCKSNQLLMSDLIEDAQLQTEITQYIESQRDEESDGDD